MSAQRECLNEWWQSLSAPERPFFRDLIRLAEDLMDEELLRMRFDGGSFSLELISGQRSAMEVGGLFASAGPEPEEWWAGLPTEARAFVRGLDKVIGDLVRRRGGSLEICNTGNGIVANQWGKRVIRRRKAGIRKKARMRDPKSDGRETADEALVSR
jgi:hypothetical protein